MAPSGINKDIPGAKDASGRSPEGRRKVARKSPRVGQEVAGRWPEVAETWPDDRLHYKGLVFNIQTHTSDNKYMVWAFEKLKMRMVKVENDDRYTF